jgi:hypothetical protein
MAAIITFWARKHIQFHLNWPDIFKTALASVLMALAIKWLPMGTWKALAVKIGLGATIFFMSLVLLRVITKENLMMLRKQF